MSFRVHKGVLVLRSDVFKTLLGDAGLEQLDGCAVLRVEDRGLDLHDLLHVVYNGGNSDWLNSSRPPIAYSDFRRVAYIAVKYNVQDVINEAKYRLSEVFQTDSLDDWDDQLHPQGTVTPLDICYFDCIDALRLSKLLGMHHITPLLFYVCCNMTPFEKIIDGVKLENVPEPVTLSQDDLRTCIRGRERLVQKSSYVMRAFQELAFDENTRPEPCQTPQHCGEALRALSLVDARCYSEPSAIDPMNPWITAHETRLDAKPCRHCDKALRTLVNQRREETWRKLGEIFEVEDWPAGKEASQIELESLHKTG